MSDKPTWPCPEDPREMLGQPVGMYHCPYCGEIQVAGKPHLPPMFPAEWDLTEEQLACFEDWWERSMVELSKREAVASTVPMENE